jgi:hypothetical protein
LKVPPFCGRQKCNTNMRLLMFGMLWFFIYLSFILPGKLNENT